MSSHPVIIFTGPSISPQDARQHLDATYLPPVKYGDVYQICELYQPQFIGIIDGYFNQVPAVWHKEILWAIHQGVAVFGAASMGALRAAELDQFGMLGCGKIYDAYHKGILPPYNDEVFEDDDEVAIVHGPAELGYLAISDAMVNIRFSFAKATQQKIIDQQTCYQLSQIAKSLFYADRQYSTILDIAVQQGVPKALIASLADWLKSNAVDQKKLDAITLLEAINDHQLNPSAQPKHKNTAFQHTAQWQAAIEEIDQSHTIEHPALDELRIKGPAYFKTLDQALEASLFAELESSIKIGEDIGALQQSPDQLQRALSEQWHARTQQSTADSLSNAQRTHLILAYLQQSRQIKALEDRASDKSKKLAELKQKPSIHQLSDIDKLQLCDWYFTQQLSDEMPEKIEDYTIELGFTDPDTFYAMILEEYLYQEVESENASQRA